LRKPMFAIVSIVAVIGLQVGSVGAASATAIRVSASGTAHCTVTKARASFNPGLHNGPSTGPVTVHLHASLACTGTSGVATGTLNAKSRLTSSSCDDLEQGTLPARAHVAWSGFSASDPLYTASVIMWSNGRITDDPSQPNDPFIATFASPGPTPPAGTTMITHSFAGETGVLKLDLFGRGTGFFIGACASTRGLTHLDVIPYSASFLNVS
jgi:hypothetical protein